MTDELIRRLSASVVLVGALTDVPYSQLLGLSVEQLAWVERRTAELSNYSPSVVNAPALRLWARAVVAEGSAEQVMANAGDGLSGRDATDRLCRLLPVQASIRVLRGAAVPRDLLTQARAKEFQVSAEVVGAALDKFRSARMALPVRRVKESAYDLDLQREITDLRNDGSWLPWDNGTSRAALRRMRSHFRSGFENRSRDELVTDLAKLHTFVVAGKELERAEQGHGKVLGKFYDSAHRHATWTAGSVAEHLQRVLDHTANFGVDAADLDAVWAMPASQTSTTAFWRAVEVLADARKVRANSYVQGAMPALTRFPNSLLSSLSSPQRRAWIDEVTRNAPILDLLTVDERERDLASVALTHLDPHARAVDGGKRIQEGFQRARGSPDGSGDLAEALATAVKASQAAFKSLETELRDVLDRTRPDDPDARTSWDREVAYLDHALKRRSEALTSFRVVLFGRTGAGKSSFVEALTRGDGQSISTGESDFTKTARPVQWGACTLIDTPGIEGWGREQSSVELETEARRALDSADLVLLAFDTQNQKVGEFEKVARWVLEFDKPTIALLNVRNAQWRRPDKESDFEVRRGHALNVREHAQHIGDALAAFGLVDTLPIAIQTFNAVAARCPNYRGPHERSVLGLRGKVSPDRLELFSHFGIVERMLTEALTRSALELRLQSLSNDTRRRLADLAEVLHRRAEVAWAAAASAEERVEATLAVIGAGAGSEQQQLDRQWRRGTALGTVDGRDLLTALEDLRQQPFAIGSMYGRVWDAWEDQCVLHLDVAALRAGGSLESSVRDAFARGDRLSIANIQTLYQQAGVELSDAADAAVRAVLADLTLELAAVAQKLSAESLHTSAEAGRGLDASRGSGLRNASRALTVVSAALLFVPIPGVNLLVAAGVRTVGQILLSVFSNRSRAAGERARAEELIQALTSARNSISGMRDDLVSMAIRQVREWVGQVAPTLRDDLQQALAARATASQCEAAAIILQDLIAAMPLQGAGSQALVAARDHLAPEPIGDTGGPMIAPTWSATALGEDWVEYVTNEPGRSRPPRPDPIPAILVAPSKDLTRSLDDLARPEPQEVTAFLATLRRQLPIELQHRLPINSGHPNMRTIALTGPQHVGVTSLASALVHQLEHHAPQHVRVLDASGPDDQQALASADVVALVVPPSLFGATDELDRYLGPHCLLVDTRERLILILTRIDELAADPDEDPDQLSDAVQRKLAEVTRFSQRSGLPPGLPILPVAGAPSGQACPAAPPWWSGVDRLADALRPTSRSGAGTAAQVRGVVAALDEFLTESTEELDTQVLPELMRADALVLTSSRGLSRGEQLKTQLRTELSRLLERVIMPHAYHLAGAANKEELRKAQEVVNGWRTSVETGKAMDAFESAMVPRLQEWLAGLGRMLDWEPAERPTPPSPGSTTGVDGGLRDDAATAASIGFKAFIKTAKQLGSRDEFYNLGKAFGVKFKPWQAVKGAQRLRNVSPALSGLGALLVALEFWNSEKAEKARNKLRHEAPAAARAELESLVDSYLNGTNEEPGPLQYVATALDSLKRERVDAAAAVEAASARRAEIERLQRVAGEARDAGIELLIRKRVARS